MLGTAVDDRTVGLVLRALRRRRGWRQVDLAARAGCSQATVSVVERGHVAGTTIAILRDLFGAVEARLQLSPSWRGAELDRLVDAEHASIVSHLARRLERAGWSVLIEVTYAIGGERGSIDVLGYRADVRAIVVCEVKSDIAAAEAVGRKLDEKGRLGPAIARDRLGWRPATVGVLLVLPESNRLRRLLAGPAAALARMYPMGSRAIGSWLRQPAGILAATWFLSDISARSSRRVRSMPMRRVEREFRRAPLSLNVPDRSDQPPSRLPHARPSPSIAEADA